MCASAAKKNVLVLGSGGREHAILVKLAASPTLGELWAAPGNGGTANLARNVDLAIEDGAAVAAFAKEHAIDLVVVGPEAPLVAGVADVCRAAGIKVFGPSAQAARLEGSKTFAKEVMEAADVPTARWESFTSAEEACAFAREFEGGCVVKADGLCGGKGVVVASSAEEAEEAIRACFDGAFGEAGAVVVVEERLSGPECSLLSLTDGSTVVALATSQDHKRALEGDVGPNTGGMGVYSPVPVASEADVTEMVAVNERVVAEMARAGSPYVGCLYGGFMLTEEGPKVLEFNCRFGDPETQVVLPRMDCDLVEVLWACATGTLDPSMIRWDSDWAVSVVLTSAGYPGSYETGKLITGVEEAEALPGVTVFHAGTKLDAAGALLTAGGRVIDVTAQAPSFEEARELAYQAADLIDFEGKTLRRDIGHRAMRSKEAWDE